MARRIVLAVYAKQTNDPNAELIHKWVMQSKTRMADKELQRLKNQCNFKSVNNFWLPTPASEFQKDYEELRAEVLK